VTDAHFGRRVITTVSFCSHVIWSSCTSYIYPLVRVKFSTLVGYGVGNSFLALASNFGGVTPREAGATENDNLFSLLTNLYGTIFFF
jgi:hypothetical protein